jgi:hypothetical protein
MLTIEVPGVEHYDEAREEFVDLNPTTLQLEHSLVSLSKWEAKWETPFLGDKPKTPEQNFDYVKLMTLTPNVPDEVYSRLSEENFAAINAYLESKQTATWFSEEAAGKPGAKQVITSELIYYWMVALTIPWDAENWHLNRLITLIRVCNQKNAPEKKMSRAEIMERQRRLNAERRAKYNTSG